MKLMIFLIGGVFLFFLVSNVVSNLFPNSSIGEENSFVIPAEDQPIVDKPSVKSVLLLRYDDDVCDVHVKYEGRWLELIHRTFNDVTVHYAFFGEYDMNQGEPSLDVDTNCTTDVDFLLIPEEDFNKMIDSYKKEQVEGKSIGDLNVYEDTHTVSLNPVETTFNWFGEFFSHINLVSFLVMLGFLIFIKRKLFD